MNLVVVRDERQECSVMALTDMHTGARGCLYGFFESAVNRALQERSRVIVLGDLFDSATTTSITPWADEDRPLQECISYMTEWLGKLAKANLLDAIVGGNHRRRIYKFSGLDIEKGVADALQVPFFTASGVVEYRIGKGGAADGSRDVYTIYMHHTARGGRLAGAAFNSLESLTQIYEGADFYCGGHTHKLGAMTTSRYGIRHSSKENDFITCTQPWLVACGSFLEWQESYAEETQLTPSPPGYVILHLARKDRGDTSVDIVRCNTRQGPEKRASAKISESMPHEWPTRGANHDSGAENGPRRKMTKKTDPRKG